MTDADLSRPTGGKARRLVLYDAPGADRKAGEHTVFGDLLRLDGDRPPQSVSAVWASWLTWRTTLRLVRCLM
jgi:hypothetical protein